MFVSQGTGAATRPGRSSLDSVLIVEDDGLIALTIEDTVRSFGVSKVHVANSAAVARSAVGEPLDCAILDILIGEEEAYDVADALALRNVPFLFCSAFTREQVTERHRHRPMLGKPYRDQDLLAWLSSLVRGCAQPNPA